jgi:UDP-GlcNAc:undecaprenyl-phosphate GlcNAc-1-phosphate transferase
MQLVQAVPAFLIVIAVIPLLSRVAPRIGLMDLPHGRKIHKGAIPLTGGIAMFIGFVLPAMAMVPQDGAEWAVLAGLTILMSAGLLDDLFDVTPWLKLAAQTTAALVMILPNANYLSLGSLLQVDILASPIISIPLTCVLIVGIINAFNLVDGIDGLAGGAAAAALFWLLTAAWLTGRTDTSAYISLLLFAVLGFLIYNMRHPWRRQASAFMGDAGSMLLGGTIGIFIVRLANGVEDDAAPLPALLWTVAIPVCDIACVTVVRLSQGRNPMTPDHNHIHYLLLNIGLSPCAATAVLVVLCLVLGGIGILGWRLGLSLSILLIGLAIPFVCHLYFVWLYRKRERPSVTATATRALQHVQDEAA